MFENHRRNSVHRGRKQNQPHRGECSGGGDGLGGDAGSVVLCVVTYR
jgi:hypothetical protein